jgi:hypothetical protein
MARCEPIPLRPLVALSGPIFGAQRRPLMTQSGLSGYYSKERLLANGDRWELAIARNIPLDAPYQ